MSAPAVTDTENGGTMAAPTSTTDEGGNSGSGSGSGSGTGTGTGPSASELELQREQAYPHYLPATGTGSKMGAGGPTAPNSVANSPAPPPPPSSVSGASASATSSRVSHPSYFPPFTTATADKATSSSNVPGHGQQQQETTNSTQHLQHQRPDLFTLDSTATSNLAPLSTSGIATPSTNFGYSPAPSSNEEGGGGFDTPPLESGESVASGTSSQQAQIPPFRPPHSTTSSNVSRSSAAAHSGATNGAHSSPDWLPSPVAEENSPVNERPAPPLPSSAKAQDALVRSMDTMALEGMEGITIVPSTRTTDANAATTASKTATPSVAPPKISTPATHSPLANTATTLSSTSTVTPSTQPSVPNTTTIKPTSLSSSTAATAGSTRVGTPVSSSQQQTRPPQASSPGHTTAPSSSASSTHHPEKRPPPPEHKKSMLGKLFHRADKDHSNQSSASPSPVPTQDHRDQHYTSSGLATSSDQRRGSRSNSTSKSKERGPSSTTASAYTSGAESDTSSVPAPPMGRSASGHGGSSSNNHNNQSSGGSAIGNFLARRTSNKKLEKPDSTLAAMANKNASKSNSALDTTGVSPNASTNALLHPGANKDMPSSTAASRGSTPDLHTAPGTPGVTTPGGGRVAGTGSPARGREDAVGGKPMMRRPSGSAHDGHRNANGTHTPIGEGQPVKEKSLKEHLAALGSSAGIGKLGRKSSQTSRRSDDGRSEKSAHHDDYHSGGEAVHTPAGHAPKRAPSIGAASNASTSLLKKYGVCEKVAIGKGATAVVRLAHKWDRSTEKLYAVKEFRKRRKNETEKEYVKKLTSEFCISSTLHHVNVVETVDLVQNEEKHWCEVMEYCPGGDLYAAIKKGDMSNEVMNVYFKQIVTGVAYLHSMGVAHRDIKPENLLLDGRGHVKITDFGVSDVFRMCWEKQTHMSKGLCGSEPYIAPEQFEQKEYDARLVDVWACAVVFYCMQAQELPWRVAKPTDPSFQTYLQNYATSSSPAPLGNLHPKECRAIIKKMLDPNPKTRLSMDAVLADPFMKSIDYTAEPIVPAPIST